MKKQGEQKTKGRKTSDTASATFPAASKTPESLSKSKITSLKDKNASKVKKGNKH